MAAFDLSPLFRQWIGFDDLTSDFERSNQYQSFPLYNIEKIDDNHYQITMALAGFKRDDLTVEKHGARLVIQGKMDGVEKIPHYIHQGLRHKTFDLSFTLADHIQVDGASFKEGLLQINLVREIPKALLPQKIAITAAS